jgi:hypothetical protein
MKRFPSIVGSTLALCLLATTPAFAGDREDHARDLKTRGDDAMLALRYDDAVVAYRDSYALVSSPALLYNQARAHQALGDWAQALEFYERFDVEAPADLKAKVPRLAGLVEEAKLRVATLTVSTTADGAQVILDDRIVGTTPLAKPIKTTARRVVLRLTSTKYAPFKRELDLKGGGAATVDVELLPKETSGVIAIASNVVARASLDGKVVGDTPAEIATPAGTHLVRLERDGFEPRESSVVVAAGSQKTVNVTLEKAPPITAKWWFWTGIGVVVLGGVAAVVVLTSERSPGEGTIAPGRVSGPLVSF